MRHRKVVSLYDEDPSHAQILDYLESFEGRNRQTNALMQMLVVGYRVMANLESGPEAYYQARNPDVRKIKRDPAPRKPLAPLPRLERPIVEPVSEAESGNTSIDAKIVIEEGEIISPVPVKPMPVPIPMAMPVEMEVPEAEDYASLDIDDALDPLMKLQMLSGD